MIPSPNTPGASITPALNIFDKIGSYPKADYTFVINSVSQTVHGAGQITLPNLEGIFPYSIYSYGLVRTGSVNLVYTRTAQVTPVVTDLAFFSVQISAQLGNTPTSLSGCAITNTYINSNGVSTTVSPLSFTPGVPATAKFDRSTIARGLNIRCPSDNSANWTIYYNPITK